ncbi:hypothetical protein FRC00_011779 [Tulasnella sp. 408]|nr:hypothetical protein FRC00_011779 [Tulasnella sp. 408]
MSPIQDIVAFAVQTYLKHSSTPEQLKLLTTDTSLSTESAKDSMVEVLTNLQSLVSEEITGQLTHLKRRRNQEHAQIHQLPQEVFVEIVLAATSFSSGSTDPFTPMKVSKYWFDTVARCPNIWSQLIVAPRPQPGIMNMMRALRGPVEVHCHRGSELDLDASFADLSTLDPNRLRALVWRWSDETEALHSFFQERNSNFVDLYLERSIYSLHRRLDLSPEGSCLRHLELRGVALPWTSPRLSQLQSLSIQKLRQDHPSVHDLYRILSSSPALRRIRIRDFQNPDEEQLDASHAITEPIYLPKLRSLQLEAPSIIINTLAPLIRSPSCQYLELRPPTERPSERLEPSDAVLDLIISSITCEPLLHIVVEHKEGGFSVFIQNSLPRGTAPWGDWGDWDDPNMGISIKLFPSTVESLRNLLEGLLSRLRAARWKPENLYLCFTRAFNGTFSHEAIPPLLLSFPLAFQTIRRLDLVLPSPAAYHYALRLLEGAVPELTSFGMYHTYAVSYEEWINGIKAFLERRYPLHLQGNISVHQKVSRLAKIHVPEDIAECLRRDWPNTSLPREVLSNIKTR